MNIKIIERLDRCQDYTLTDQDLNWYEFLDINAHVWFMIFLCLCLIVNTIFTVTEYSVLSDSSPTVIANLWWVFFYTSKALNSWFNSPCNIINFDICYKLIKVVTFNLHHSCLVSTPSCQPVHFRKYHKAGMLSRG